MIDIGHMCLGIFEKKINVEEYSFKKQNVFFTKLKLLGSMKLK